MASSLSTTQSHYFINLRGQVAFPCLPLPSVFSQSLFLFLLAVAVGLKAVEKLNGQSQDEVIMSLYHYILLLPFLVTENPEGWGCWA